MMRNAILAALLLIPAGRILAESGALKGTINTEGTPARPVADAVVMVEGPSVPAPAGARHAVVDQRGEAFVPHVLAVPLGTTVDFPNHDPTLHNVYSTSLAKKFDLGMYAQGETRSVTFDTPGIVRIGCSAHPKMEAFVVVHGNPYVAVTDAHGAYTIEGIPPGSYDVRVWRDGSAERKVPVIVRAGVVQPLDVKLAPPR